MFPHHSLIPWGSFRGRQEEKWGSFRGRNHFGVDLGIISGSGSFRGLYRPLRRRETPAQEPTHINGKVTVPYIKFRTLTPLALRNTRCHSMFRGARRQSRFMPFPKTLHNWREVDMVWLAKWCKIHEVYIHSHSMLLLFTNIFIHIQQLATKFKRTFAPIATAHL